MSHPGSAIDGNLGFEFSTHDSSNPPDRRGNNRNNRSNNLKDDLASGINKEIIESNNRERKRNADPHKNAHSRVTGHPNTYCKNRNGNGNGIRNRYGDGGSAILHAAPSGSCGSHKFNKTLSKCDYKTSVLLVIYGKCWNIFSKEIKHIIKKKYSF